VRLLLDSHTLLWWMLDDSRLSARARGAIEATTNTILVSAATAWEIAIKAAKGKLKLPAGGENRIRAQMIAAGFEELAVTWQHGFAVRLLTGLHADPFDRLLIAQSRVEGVTIVTNDRAIRSYPVDVLW
jgi:PIN domain nuclease of toxin-antitoxin system